MRKKDKHIGGKGFDLFLQLREGYRLPSGKMADPLDPGTASNSSNRAVDSVAAIDERPRRRDDRFA